MNPQGIAENYTSYYTDPAYSERPFRSYIDNATKGFLLNVARGQQWPHTGAGDTETNAVAHVLPVVVMRAGRPGFLQEAENAIRVVQDNEDAVAFGLTFARILERVILGDVVSSAIDEVRRVLAEGVVDNRNNAFFAHGLGKMQEWSQRPPFDVTLELGQACDFPFHVLTAPHMLLNGGENLEFVAAIRATIKIGGENANRGSFVGSILAARAGSADASVPVEEWQSSTTHIEEVRHLAEMIADGGTSGSPPPPPPHPRLPLRSWPPTVLGNSPGCVAHGNATTRCDAPASHADDVAALVALFHSTGGATTWLRNACWLNTSIPVCCWDQVLCNNTSGRVRELRLASNNLVGRLPAEGLARAHR